MAQSDGKRYLRQVRSWLPCSGKLKRKILGEIGERVSHFLEENPEGDYAAIVARFGTPQQIAASYVDNMDTQELLNDLRIKRKIVSIIAAVAIVVIVIWVIIMGTLLIDGLVASHGYITEYPIVEH